MSKHHVSKYDVLNDRHTLVSALDDLPEGWVDANGGDYEVLQMIQRYQEQLQDDFARLADLRKLLVTHMVDDKGIRGVFIAGKLNVTRAIVSRLVKEGRVLRGKNRNPRW